MSHRLLPLVFALIVTLNVAQPQQRPPAEASIKVPPGFVVEKVAGPPLVEHPMFACFDDRGRLFVADAAGVNLPAAELLKKTPNRIVLLEDTKGNGVFDKSTVFADNLTLPMGVLWHQGALYTAAPPSIWKLEDTNDDGKADKRTELVTKFGFTGNAADIHGPFLGPDGRLYWCDGRHGHEIKQPDGKTMKGKAARIFRCKPDGSEVEVVCGGGMDNPVEIAFTEEGEAIATCNILLPRPRVDALIHCVEGGVWPWNDVHNEFPKTGDLLPALSELGWVAPAGLMRYRSEVFGTAFRDNLFSAQFNRHRVQRHVLKRDGATFKATNEDFLVSSDNDFHPTDVLEDADGSLLVIDTGGWFRIGCPTSQIAKPDIKGAIYRIRKKDAPKMQYPRGNKWGPKRLLVSLLDDPRPAVRDRGIDQLAKWGDKAIKELRTVVIGEHTEMSRRNAAWALTRIGSPEATAVLRMALLDEKASVRQVAVYGLGLLRDAKAGEALRSIVLEDGSAPVRREAATALGRLRQKEAVSVLLDALDRELDRFGEHAVLYALIHIGDRDAVLKGLQHKNANVRRGALIVLDQMPGGDLTQDLVTPLLSSDDAALQRTALDIISRRPAWAGDVVGLLRQWLGEEKQDARRRDTLRSTLLALGKTETVQGLLGEALTQDKTPVPSRLLALETMTRLPAAKLPSSWSAGLQRSLTAKDDGVLLQAIAAIEANKVKDFDGTLQNLAGQTMRSPQVRVAALAAVAPRLEHTHQGWLDFLETRLKPEVPPLERLAAAQALGRLPLDLTQLESLAGQLSSAGPLELPYLLAAFEKSTNPAVGRKLLAALRQAKGIDALSTESVRRLLQGYPANVRSSAVPLLLRLENRLEAQQGRLRELEPLLTGGDARRGRDVFFGKKAICSACHMVRGEGERTGPDLSTIGAIRPGRDLLESLVFPSASFVRGYEPFNVTTRAGKTITGILARETADAITLMTTERVEVRIPRANIESFEPGTVSIMPQGLDTQLSRQELNDLLAFLQSLR
jgi:putative heme-binding domain-containing protein